MDTALLGIKASTGQHRLGVPCPALMYEPYVVVLLIGAGQPSNREGLESNLHNAVKSDLTTDTTKLILLQ